MARENNLSGALSTSGNLSGSLRTYGDITGNLGIPRQVDQNDYEGLNNLPQIEGVTLIGNKSFEDLNLHALTNAEIEALLT